MSADDRQLTPNALRFLEYFGRMLNPFREGDTELFPPEDVDTAAAYTELTEHPPLITRLKPEEGETGRISLSIEGWDMYYRHFGNND